LLPRDRMIAVNAVIVCPSVRLSVCLCDTIKNSIITAKHNHRNAMQ